MSFTASQIAKLNKMNRAAQDVSLGTVINGQISGVASGSIVSAAQASASAVSFVTGLTAISGFMVQAFRSGSAVSPLYGSASGGTLTVTSASASYKITTGDVINYIAW